MRSRRVVAIFLLTCLAYSQIPDSAPAVVADIPVNYSEANAGTYTLPDPLKLNNGQPVKDSRMWFAKRRPEIRKLIEENWFGRALGRPKEMTVGVVEQGAAAFDGKATRRQVIIYFTKDRTGPRMDLLVYLPSNAKGPVPLSLNMSRVSRSVFFLSAASSFLHFRVRDLLKFLRIERDHVGDRFLCELVSLLFDLFPSAVG